MKHLAQSDIAAARRLLAAISDPSEPANDDIGVDRTVIEERATLAAQRMRRARKR